MLHLRFPERRPRAGGRGVGFTVRALGKKNIKVNYMPVVKPLKEDDGPTVKQPKAPFRALPANSLHIGPSGSGKSVALIRTLIDRDKLGGCFDAYHVFSPNVWVDSQYRILGKYIQDHTGQKLEDCFHDWAHINSNMYIYIYIYIFSI